MGTRRSGAGDPARQAADKIAKPEQQIAKTADGDRPAWQTARPTPRGGVQGGSHAPDLRAKRVIEHQTDRRKSRFLSLFVGRPFPLLDTLATLHFFKCFRFWLCIAKFCNFIFRYFFFAKSLKIQKKCGKMLLVSVNTYHYVRRLPPYVSV